MKQTCTTKSKIGYESMIVILLVFYSSIIMNDIILPVTLSAFCFANKNHSKQSSWDSFLNDLFEWFEWMMNEWTSHWLTNKESLVSFLKWFVPEWITVFKSIERIIKWLTCFVPEIICVLEQIIWMNWLRQSLVKTYTGIIRKHAGKSPLDSLILILTLILLEITTNNCRTVNNIHKSPSIYCENWV